MAMYPDQENPLPRSAGEGSLPAFRSLALDSIPFPDYADVIVLPVPDGLHNGDGGEKGAIEDPRVWAEALFSAKSMPAWVVALMGLRQTVVGLIGASRATAGVFAVSEVRGEEALISTDDRHLDFRCGVAYDAGARLLRVTTTVRLKGWRGRLYFFPVRLLHPLVVHAMMARAVRRLTQVPASRQ
ncbi:hypothetical protein QFZ40_002497 [Arthrobacter pascens]|uniref:DUF2867 domain-containing protein n=1 Tax=Arthrobacter pascens TaxID=1677 RepID=UPI002787C7E6|nr:DUF2867 domain-containing protein [Arthrobacter pascens]MDQ0634588.1 hypothetical protein [Arthrobacter pascens]